MVQPDDESSVPSTEWVVGGGKQGMFGNGDVLVVRSSRNHLRWRYALAGTRPDWLIFSRCPVFVVPQERLKLIPPPRINAYDNSELSHSGILHPGCYLPGKVKPGKNRGSG